MPTKLANEIELWDIFAIDERGRPTTYLSFMILKSMFSEPKRWFTPKELTKLLAAKYSDTETICHQLEMADLITENPSQPGQYRYNLKTRNVELQVGFEKFLVDVELESLPVHLMLTYSPSFRSLAHLSAARPG